MKKRSDGRYRQMVNGRCFYGSTVAEVRAKIREYESQAAQQIEHRTTVEGFAQSWLPIAKAGVTRRTYNQYAGCLDRLLAVCGDKPLLAVKPSDISTVYAAMASMSASSIHTTRVIIEAMFDAAIADGYLSRNPAKSATAPEGTRGSHRAITDTERHTILTTPHRLRPMVMMMLYAGLRRGEALALDVSRDVDLVHGTITVSRAVRYESNQPILADPKTASGFRTIPLMDEAREAISGVSGLLACGADGRMMSETAFTRAWSSYCHVTGLAIRPHDLRHSYCTMLRDRGVELNVAKQWMGHGDERMILRIYDHITDGRLEANRALLGIGERKLSIAK